MKIGIAGTGSMGTAMGIRLLGVGHELCVWNRTPAKTKALAGLGSKDCSSLMPHWLEHGKDPGA